jgi:hypothetical protein
MDNAAPDGSQGHAPLVLSELFQQIVTRFQALLNNNPHAVKDSDFARMLDDMLLKLRHWSNEIKFDRGALDLLEMKSTNLTQATRFFLGDIDSSLSKVEQACGNAEYSSQMYVMIIFTHFQKTEN